MDNNYNLLSQGLKDLSFENKIGFNLKSDEMPNVGVDVSVFYEEIDKNIYEVTLQIVTSAKQGEDTLFLVDIQYAALCEVEDQTNLEKILLVKVPEVIFPYARHITSSTTSEGGFPPLFIQPVNFEELLANKNSKTNVAGNA